MRTPEEVRKLLGGYATGTLTEAERQALFAAALEDQQLFDELAREQSVHDLLQDPAALAEMLAALEDRPKPWAWWRPAAAALAIAAIATLAVVLPRRKAPVAFPPIVAEVKPPTPETIPPPPLEPPLALRRAASKPIEKPAEKRKSFEPPPPPPPRAEVAALPEPPKAEAPKPAAPPGAIGGTPGGGLGGFVPSAPAPQIVAISPPPARNSLAPSTAETVEVTAAAPMMASQQLRLSARDIFYGNRSAPLRLRTAARQAAAPAREIGLRYVVVRKQGDDFVEADPADLPKSDTLALRFTANENGYLSLAGGAPVALTAMEPYTTPPLDPGANEIRVVFARTPQTTLLTPATLLTEARGREVFVVNTIPAAALGFTVALKRK